MTNTSSRHSTNVWCFSKPVKLQHLSAQDCCLGQQFTVLRHNQALNFYRFNMSSSASSGESLQEADSTVISQKAEVKNYSMMTPAEKLSLCETRAQSLADSEEVHMGSSYTQKCITQTLILFLCNLISAPTFSTIHYELHKAPQACSYSPVYLKPKVSVRKYR